MCDARRRLGSPHSPGFAARPVGLRGGAAPGSLPVGLHGQSPTAVPTERRRRTTSAKDDSDCPSLPPFILDNLLTTRPAFALIIEHKFYSFNTPPPLFGRQSGQSASSGGPIQHNRGFAEPPRPCARRGVRCLRQETSMIVHRAHTDVGARMRGNSSRRNVYEVSDDLFHEVREHGGRDPEHRVRPVVGAVSWRPKLGPPHRRCTFGRASVRRVAR